jgi:hypothetical protein
MSRWIDGGCDAGANPCDDNDVCTTDSCDSQLQMCTHILDRTIQNCNTTEAECNTFGCVPQCNGLVCGDNGCGGLCGVCPSDQGCLNGACQSLSGRQGTCLSPLTISANPVVANTVYRVSGDTSNGIHLNKPSCNPEALAPELIYKFRVPANARFGVDIRVGNVSIELDTILELRKENCTPPVEAYANQYGTIVGCADDSTPPGAYGSRVEALVYGGPNGTDYFVLVSGYCQTCVGPLYVPIFWSLVFPTHFLTTVRCISELVLHVTDGCIPTCDGKFCGASLFCPSSSYGCGQCPDGEECTNSQRCRPINCVPDCTNGQGGNKTCGDDGCGGSCGSCIDGVEHCDVKTSTCHVLPTCNTLHPICTEGCNSTQYCGSDCKCYNLNEPIPDLTLIQSDLLDMSDEWTYFDNISCASIEGCVGGTGWRRLLRFTVSALNQGYKDLAPGNPEDVPDLFEYSPCHAHFHFEDFARYYLLNPSDGGIALTGRKQAYCMLDSHRTFDGSASPCRSQYACDNQGVSVGWVDTYSQSLDCQWLDITGIAAGQYDLYVVLNPRRIFHESSWENNAGTVRVNITVSSPPANPGAPVSAGNPSPVPVAASVPFASPTATQNSAPKAKSPSGLVNSAPAVSIAVAFLMTVTLCTSLFL